MSPAEPVTTSIEPDPIVEPVAEPVVAPVSEPEPTSEPSTEQPIETADKTEAKRKPWYQKRIDELTAKNYEEKGRADAVTTEAAVLRATLDALKTNDPANPVTTPSNPQDFQAAVRAESTRIAQETSFNQKCNEVAENGSKEFPDFQQAAANYHNLGGPPPQQFLEAITSLPDGHKVFHHLGMNLDEAAHVLSLPPVQMALEISRISQKLNVPKAAAPVSKAPAPINPLDGTARVEFDPEKEQDMKKFANWLFERKQARG